MSVTAIILVMLGGLLGLQLWTGKAIGGRGFRSQLLNDPEPEQIVDRDMFPHLYWLSIGIQSAAVVLGALTWWRE